MLADDDDAGDAAVLARFYDLLGVEFGRGEPLRILVAVAPFLVVERIRAEMQDRVDVVVPALKDAFGWRAPLIEFRQDRECLPDGVGVFRRRSVCGEENRHGEGEQNESFANDLHLGVFLCVEVRAEYPII